MTFIQQAVLFIVRNAVVVPFGLILYLPGEWVVLVVVVGSRNNNQTKAEVEICVNPLYEVLYAFHLSDTNLCLLVYS